LSLVWWFWEGLRDFGGVAGVAGFAKSWEKTNPPARALRPTRPLRDRSRGVGRKINVTECGQFELKLQYWAITELIG
jgi:hypothetical protein